MPDAEYKIRISAEGDTSVIKAETAALQDLETAAKKADTALKKVGDDKPAAHQGDWVRDQMQRTRAEAEALGRQRSGAGPVADVAADAGRVESAIGGVEAAASVSAGGGVLKWAAGLGAARIALLGLVGLAGGVAIGALAGLIGWLAKGAAETPAFQRGLDNAKGALSGLGAECNRAAQPVKDFLGNLAGDTLTWFSDQVQVAGENLAILNDKAGLPDLESGRRAMESFGREAASTAHELDALVGTANRLGDALDKSLGKFETQRDRLHEQAEATAALSKSQIDLAESQGKLTAEQADRARLEAKQRSENRQLEADQRNLPGEADAAAKNAEDIAGLKAEAEAKLRRDQAELAARTAQIGPKPAAEAKEALDTARKSVQEQQAAVEKLGAQYDEAAKKAGDLRQQVNLLTVRSVTLANQQATETDKQDRGEKKSQAQDDLKDIEAAHQARLAAIARENADAVAAAQARLAEERTYQQAKLAALDQISQAQNTYDEDHRRNVEAANAALDLVAGKLATAQEKAALQPARTPRATLDPDRQRHYGTDRIEIGQGSKDDHLYAPGSRIGGGAADARSRPTPNGRDAAGSALQSAGQAGEKAAGDLSGGAAAISASAAAISAAASQLSAAGASLGSSVSQLQAAVKALEAKVSAQEGGR